MARVTDLLLLKETEAAIQVQQILPHREPCVEWIPKSVCTISRLGSAMVSITIEDWFFEKKSKLIEK